MVILDSKWSFFTPKMKAVKIIPATLQKLLLVLLNSMNFLTVQDNFCFRTFVMKHPVYILLSTKTKPPPRLTYSEIASQKTLQLLFEKIQQTRRAFTSVRSCKICMGVIVVIILVMFATGENKSILLRRLCTKSYFVGFAQKQSQVILNFGPQYMVFFRNNKFSTKQNNMIVIIKHKYIFPYHY